MATESIDLGCYENRRAHAGFLSGRSAVAFFGVQDETRREKSDDGSATASFVYHIYVSLTACETAKLNSPRNDTLIDRRHETCTFLLSKNSWRTFIQYHIDMLRVNNKQSPMNLPCDFDSYDVESSYSYRIVTPDRTPKIQVQG